MSQIDKRAKERMMHIELHDPRPDDPAQLARAVAKTLRAAPYGRLAIAVDAAVHVVRSVGEYESRDAWRLTWFPHSMLSSAFDNLGPIAIAHEIQRVEAQRAQEWAGDV